MRCSRRSARTYGYSTVYPAAGQPGLVVEVL